jgi:aspartate racemase
VQHIGIVGCSAEGASLCFRTICAEAPALLGPFSHPEVSMHTPSLAAYMDCFARDDWFGVAALMLTSANKLSHTGVDFLICPDNTIHRALPHVLPRSPLPWLHIAEVVADEAANRGFKRLGLIGTQWLMDGPVYANAFAAGGVALILPHDDEQRRVNRIIIDELTYGAIKLESVAYFQGVIARMAASGCEAVILGCTEIPLVINDDNSPLPTLDSTRLLARAAVRRAIGHERATRRHIAL